MRIIVGRRALLYSTDRMSLVPYEGDHDWWVSSEVDKEHLSAVNPYKNKLDICVMPESVMENFHNLSKSSGVAILEDLLAIKLSHLQYNIFWKKHKQDVLALKKLTNNQYNKELYAALAERWKKEFSGEKSKLSLYRTRDQFFDDFVPKAFEHDYLHTLVAKDGVPVYSTCLKEGQEVLVDKNKFDNLRFIDQIRMFKEEIAVIALERWMVPSLTNKKVTFIMLSDAWDRAVHKTVTALTKNWASEFICLNIEHFTSPLYEEMLNALSILNLKEKYKMNETLTYEQIEELFDERTPGDKGWYGFTDFLISDDSDPVEGFVMTIKVNSHAVKIHRGRTEHTQEIIRYKDTYVLDGWYLCILRELVETDEDYYWVLQGVANENIYMLTGVTSPIYLKGKIEDNDYRSIYAYHREKLDRQWQEWKSKVIT